MSVPELAPRRTIGGVVSIWAVAAVAGIIVGLFVPAGWRAEWLTLALAGCLVLSFAVQLWYGRSQGFIQRVAASTLGALLVLGVISVGFGIAALLPV
ncbi:MAG: hypothetical protein KKH75_07850 [Actinobacteria bacterium]|nr:hypothetical protein [Actinomycetota bacterium]